MVTSQHLPVDIIRNQHDLEEECWQCSSPRRVWCRLGPAGMHGVAQLDTDADLFPLLDRINISHSPISPSILTSLIIENALKMSVPLKPLKAKFYALSMVMVSSPDYKFTQSHHK